MFFVLVCVVRLLWLECLSFNALLFIRVWSARFISPFLLVSFVLLSLFLSTLSYVVVFSLSRRAGERGSSKTFPSAQEPYGSVP